MVSCSLLSLFFNCAFVSVKLFKSLDEDVEFLYSIT